MSNPPAPRFSELTSEEDRDVYRRVSQRIDGIDVVPPNCSCPELFTGIRSNERQGHVTFNQMELSETEGWFTELCIENWINIGVMPKEYLTS